MKLFCSVLRWAFVNRFENVQFFSQVPRVDEPAELWRKIKDFTDEYRKPPEK